MDAAMSKAMSSRYCWEKLLRFFPLGGNWRKRPLVFSLMPRSQGACGWVKLDVGLALQPTVLAGYVNWAKQVPVADVASLT
jgi:hypothetical protein